MITHKLSRYADGRLNGDVECSVLVNGMSISRRDPILWVSRLSGRRITPPRTEAALARRVAFCGLCGRRIVVLDAADLVEDPSTKPGGATRTSTTG